MAFARLVFYGTEAQTFLAAGPTDGGWEVAMVWDWKDAFQRWAAEHAGPARQRVGTRGWQSSPEIRDFETYHVLS